MSLRRKGARIMGAKRLTFEFADWPSCVAARLAITKVPLKDGEPVMTEDDWTIEGIKDRLQKDCEKGMEAVHADKLAINDNAVTIVKE
jgi:hypothetical protein